MTTPSRGTVVAGLLLAAFVIRLPTLGYPLVEAHAFRQTQTAITAVVYHRDGIDLLHTPMPTIGPPWQLPFEFPLFQGAAALVMDVGLGVEPAVRLTNLVLFMVTALAIVWLLREFGQEALTIPVLVAYLFSPFALEWSRASIIDYLAVAPTLGAIAAARRAETTGRSRWWVLAAVLGVVSALVKITTAVIWLVAALVIARGRRPMVLVCAIAFAAGFVWTEYADSIRQTGPLTRLFSSSTLTTWTLGAPLDRIDPTLWALWIWHLTPLGVIGLIGLVFIRAVPGDRRLWVLSTIAMALAYAVFPTLFAQHSYYAVAVSPAVALLLGAAWRGAILARPRRFVLIATAALAVGTFAVSLPKWIVAFGPADPDHELVSAAQIQAATSPTDRVLIIGRDYSPAILFYADRQGIALPLAASVTDLPADLVAGYRRFDCGIDRAGDCVAITP